MATCQGRHKLKESFTNFSLKKLANLQNLQGLSHTRTHVHNKSVIIVLIERSVSLLSIAGNDECIRSQAKQTAEFCFRMQE